MKAARYAAAVIALGALSACGGGAGDHTGTVIPKDSSYATVDQLHDAAVAAGYTCEGWVVDNKEKLAAESDHCGPVDRFETFATKDDLQAQLVDDRKSDQLVQEAGVKASQLEPRLIGPNWIIQGPVGDLGDTLGGTLEVPEG